jgi:hypothetical protein
MTDHAETLSSGEFSRITGLSVSAITKMLRRGSLRGEKRGGKWAICASECRSPVLGIKKAPAQPPIDLDDPPAEISAVNAATYDVETFARMTYLTEKGVRQWLKNGRLSGRSGTDGKDLVDAINLSRPELRHLIRH